MLCRKDGRAEHIEESMHLRCHLIAKLSNWMMQTGRELDWELMRSRRHERPGDLRRSRKCIRRYAASAQFVTEGG